MSKTKSEENSDPNEDIIFIGSIQNTIITRSSDNQPVFQYYTQEVDSPSDSSDSEDFAPLVTRAATNFAHKKSALSTSEEDEDEDEDIKLIYDNKALMDRIDGTLKKLNSDSEDGLKLPNVEAKTTSVEVTSPILVTNKEPASTTRTKSEEETDFIVLDNDDDTSNEGKLDDLLCVVSKNYENSQKKAKKSILEYLNRPDKNIEKEDDNKKEDKTPYKSLMLGESKKTPTAHVSSKRTILLDNLADERNKRRKLLFSPSAPKNATTSKTTSAASSKQIEEEQEEENEMEEEEVEKEIEKEVEKAVEKKTPNEKEKEKEIDMDENSNDSFDALNPIDAQKKKLIKLIESRNNMMRMGAGGMQSKTKQLTRDQLINMSSHDKARQLLAKSHQSNVSSSLSLTQSLNVAKVEHQMRMQAFQAERAKKAETTKTNVPSIAKPANPNPKPKPPPPPQPQKEKEPIFAPPQPPQATKEHEFKRVNNKLRNNSVQESSGAQNQNKKIKLTNQQPAQTCAAQNDIVGNILNEMHKQKILDKPNQDKENIRTVNMNYIIENFFFRIVKCSYNWLIEQEKFSTDTTTSFRPPPVVSDEELIVLTDFYLSFEDYFKAMFPNLLCETWEDIYRIWKERKSQAVSTSSTESVMWIKSWNQLEQHNGLLALTCQIVLPQNSRSAPNEDDLIKIELDVKTSQDRDYFAIVQSCHKLKRDENRILRCVSEYMYGKKSSSETSSKPKYTESSPCKPLNNDEQLSVYEIVLYVRYRKYTNNPDTMINYEMIGSMASSFRRVKALFGFPRSKLMGYLLNPNSENPVFFVNKEKEPTEQQKLFRLNEYNESQQSVILEASSIIMYNEPKLYFLQGPPGTGKSHTIVGIVNAMFTRVMHQKQTSASTTTRSLSTSGSKPAEIDASIIKTRKFRLLICSPSNGGCDELTRRLKQARIDRSSAFHALEQQQKRRLSIIRIGRVESIHADCDDVGFDQMVKAKIDELAFKKQSEKSVSLKENYNSLLNTEKNLRKKIEAMKTSSSTNKNDLNEIENNLEELIKRKKKFESQIKTKSNENMSNLSLQERKNIEKQAKELVLKDADIIICTLNFCGNQMLDCLTSEKNGGQALINAIIIDEAAQCLEVDSLIPLRFGCTKLIEVGDPEQLPATVLSKLAQDKNFGMSLFERIYQKFRFSSAEYNPIKMLFIQYRMHPEICIFPSKNFYRGKLRTNKETENRLSTCRIKPYTVFNVKNGQEIGDEVNGSIYNPIEGDHVIDFCKYLKSFNQQFSCGVITPYQKQCQYLREKLINNKLDMIEVGTVDGFQGREKDLIVFSCVRARGANRTIGFLAHRQRLNVALTRAKFGLYIFGHFDTLKICKDWENCIEDAEKRGLVMDIN